MSGARDVRGVTQPASGDHWGAGEGGRRSVYPHPRHTASANSCKHACRLPTALRQVIMCPPLMDSLALHFGMFLFIFMCVSVQLVLWDVGGSWSRQHFGPANHGDNCWEAEHYGTLCGQEGVHAKARLDQSCHKSPAGCESEYVCISRGSIKCFLTCLNAFRESHHRAVKIKKGIRTRLMFMLNSDVLIILNQWDFTKGKTPCHDAPKIESMCMPRYLDTVESHSW